MVDRLTTNPAPIQHISLISGAPAHAGEYEDTMFNNREYNLRRLVLLMRWERKPVRRKSGRVTP